MKKLNINRLLLYSLIFLPWYLLITQTFYCSVNIPYWEQWRLEIPLLESLYTKTLTFNDLFCGYLGHKLFFPKIIWCLIAYMTNWNIIYEIALNLILGTGIFLILWTKIKRICELIKIQSIYFIPILSVIIFSLKQNENWLNGIHIHIFLSIFFSLQGIALITTSPLSLKKVILSGILGIMTMLSNGNGVLFFPITLIALYIQLRNTTPSSKKYFLTWSLLCALSFFLFIYKNSANDINLIHNITFCLHHPVKYITFTFMFLGNPISTRFAILFGILEVVVFLWTTSYIYIFLRESFNKLSFIILIGCYSICIALLCGISRLNWNLLCALQSRYITFSMFFLLANSFLLYIIISKRSNSSKLIKLMCIWCLVIFVSFTIHGSITIGLLRFEDNYRSLKFCQTSLLKEPHPDEVRQFLCIDNSLSFKNKLTFLKQNKLSLFKE